MKKNLFYLILSLVLFYFSALFTYTVVNFYTEQTKVDEYVFQEKR